MSENQPKISAAHVAQRICHEAQKLPSDIITPLFQADKSFEDLTRESAETLDERLLALIEQRISTTPLALILALLTEYTIESFFNRPSSKELPATIARVQTLVSIIHRLGEYDASVVIVNSIAGRAAQSEDLTAMHAGRHLQKALTMPAVLELLFTRLEEPQHFSSRAAILNYLQAISEIGLDALLAALNTVKEKETRTLLIKIISQNQIPEPEQLLESMRKAKPVVMLDYFDLAPHVSTEVLASLILVALEQKHPALLMRVLRLLLKFPTGAADKILSKYLSHEIVEVRIVAYQIAAIRKSQPCRANLRLRVLSEEIWQLGTKEVRALTCAFATISGPDSISALSKLLKPKIFQKKNVDVQVAAAFALAQLNDARARAHIEKAAKSMNAKIREGCKRALAPGAGEANLLATLGTDFAEKGFSAFEPNAKDWLQRVIDKQRKDKNLLVENAQGVYDEDPRDTRTEDELFANVLKPHNEPDELPTHMVSAPEERVQVGNSESSIPISSDRETVPEMPTVSITESSSPERPSSEMDLGATDSFSSPARESMSNKGNIEVQVETEDSTVQWSIDDLDRATQVKESSVSGAATQQEVPLFTNPARGPGSGVPVNEFDERIPTRPQHPRSQHSMPAPPNEHFRRNPNAETMPFTSPSQSRPNQVRHPSQSRRDGSFPPNPGETGAHPHRMRPPSGQPPMRSVPPPPSHQRMHPDTPDARTHREMPQWQAPPPGWTVPSQESPPQQPFPGPGSRPNLRPLSQQQIDQHRANHPRELSRPHFQPPQNPHGQEIPAGREPTRRKLSDDFKKSKLGDRPPTRDGQPSFSTKNDPRFKK